MRWVLSLVAANAVIFFSGADSEQQDEYQTGMPANSAWLESIVGAGYSGGATDCVFATATACTSTGTIPSCRPFTGGGCPDAGSTCGTCTGGRPKICVNSTAGTCAMIPGGVACCIRNVCGTAVMQANGINRCSCDPQSVGANTGMRVMCK